MVQSFAVPTGWCAPVICWFTTAITKPAVVMGVIDQLCQLWAPPTASICHYIPKVYNYLRLFIVIYIYIYIITIIVLTCFLYCRYPPHYILIIFPMDSCVIYIYIYTYIHTYIYIYICTHTYSITIR